MTPFELLNKIDESMPIDLFLKRFHDIGFTATDSEIRAMICPHPLDSHFGNKDIIRQSDIKQIISSFCKDATEGKIVFIAKCLSKNTEVRILKDSTKIANQKELQELFDDLQKRNERGINLSLEMKNRGFAPVIHDFDFSNIIISYLIIEGVTFTNCRGGNFVNCYIRQTELPTHSNVVDCISKELNLSFIEMQNKVREITGEKCDHLIIQMLMDSAKFRDMNDDIYKFLNTFQGDGNQQCIDFAYFCLNSLGDRFINIVSKFGIKDEKIRQEFAKECFKISPKKLICQIGNFQITDKRVISTLLIIGAPDDVGLVTDSIQKHGIEEQDSLKEIALECAKYAGRETAKNIKNFGIKDEQTRFEIALICLKTANIFQFFERFEITDAELQLALVKNARKLDVVDFFQNLNIPDEQMRIQIAMMCAQEDPYLGRSIKKFGITDQKALIQIAIELAKNHGTTAKYIEKFKIDDQEALITIAKLCISKKPDDVIDYLRLFKIEDKKALFEIARECIKTVGRIYSYTLMELFDEVDLFELVKLCFKYGNDIDELFLKHLNIKNREECYLYYYSETPIPFADLHVFPSPKTLADFNTKSIADDLKLIRNDYALKQSTFWFENTIKILSHSTTPEQREFINKTQILNHIHKIDDPKLRWRLTYCLYKFVQTNHFEHYEIRDSKRDLTGKLKKAERAQCLIELVCAILKERKISFEFDSKVFIKDTAKLNIFLNAFTRLVTDVRIDNKRLVEIIENVFSDSSLLIKRLNFLSVIYDLSEEDVLINDKGSIDDLLKGILQKKLKNIITLDDKSTQRLQELFSSSRNSEAIYIYLSKINSLNDPKIKEGIQDFLQIILNGNLSEARYDTTKNIHFQKIEETFPEVLKNWKINREVPLSEIKVMNIDDKDFNIKSWMYQKLVTDKHSPQLPDLISYLKDEIKTLPKNPDETIDQIQTLCIELIQKPDNENFIKLKKLVSGTEFENDINALTSKKREISASAVVVETDDLHDILLCGTDVQGSCQRVNGDPNNNRGLLGYLMNGQTRLLAVKTKAGVQGAIQARCLLRLLWDDVQNKPVLFRERLYPAPILPELEAALNAMAKEKAAALDLDLLSMDQGKKYPNPIKCLGGRAPYEYVDASLGIQYGEYEITSARYMK